MSEPAKGSAGPLEQELQALRLRAREAMSAETMQGIAGCIEAMREQQDCPRGLELGAEAPDFVLSEAWGAQFWLKEALEKGPLVLLFYRGTWCSFCQVALSAWQKRYAEMQAAGIQLVAISPQYPEATGEMVKSLGLEFPLLCDPGNRVARKFGVVCRQESTLREVNDLAGADLPGCNKDTSQELPLPGTFVIAADSTVQYQHVDVDFTFRAEPGEVLAVAALRSE